ncbi:hypothetical protein MSG28_011659 [Choristoneura fumiferana]|uniref:Uncharacterized protein n=1 Tax=Choristoneura fumiferana TaxID=7141 RepID=A0ACC0KM85_CHOFU|nr:hypothetical protein MSG28_011659 [Choristoneura fumiferana]
MFSGLTNQVSSWMGAAKGDPQDEEVPTPTKEATAEPAAEGERQSPTKPGGKLDLITNVQSKMTGWLGSGIPIPGLRKNDAAPSEATEAAPVEPAEPAEPKLEGKDDDDNSSATGGADMTTKAVAGAKSLGNFLYSAVNKAGAKVSEASAKIKKTVEENRDTAEEVGCNMLLYVIFNSTEGIIYDFLSYNKVYAMIEQLNRLKTSILGEFNREQDAFIKGQAGGGGAATAPWVGAPNEAALKEDGYRIEPAISSQYEACKRIFYVRALLELKLSRLVE